MAGLLHPLTSAHNLDDSVFFLGPGHRDLGGSLQLNGLELLPLSADDESMVLLGDLEVNVSLGERGWEFHYALS